VVRYVQTPATGRFEGSGVVAPGAQERPHVAAPRPAGGNFNNLAGEITTSRP
jgi:hypothetical protein